MAISSAHPRCKWKRVRVGTTLVVFRRRKQLVAAFAGRGRRIDESPIGTASPFRRSGNDAGFGKEVRHLVWQRSRNVLKSSIVVTRGRMSKTKTNSYGTIKTMNRNFEMNFSNFAQKQFFNFQNIHHDLLERACHKRGGGDHRGGGSH